MITNVLPLSLRFTV